MAESRLKLSGVAAPLSPYLQLVDASGHPTAIFIALWQDLVEGSYTSRKGLQALASLLAKGIKVAPGQLSGGGLLGGDGDIKLGLAPTGVTPGLVCSSSAIPCINVDQFGRIVSLSTIPISKLDLANSTGKLPVTRLEGPVTSAMLAPNSITSRELDIPTPSLDGHVVVGSSGSGFHWESPQKLLDTGFIDHSGAVFTAQSLNTGAPFRFAFSNKVAGGSSYMGVDAEGFITIHDPHHTRFMVVVILDLLPEHLVVTSQTIIRFRMEASYSGGPWLDVGVAASPSAYLREIPCGSHRAVGATFFSAALGKHIRLRISVPVTSSKEDDLWNIPGAQAFALVHPLEVSDYVDSPAIRHYEGLTKTRIELSAEQLGVGLIKIYDRPLPLQESVNLKRVADVSTMVYSAYHWSDTPAVISKRAGSPDILYHGGTQIIGLVARDSRWIQALRNARLQVTMDVTLHNTSFAKLSILSLTTLDTERFMWPPWWYVNQYWSRNSGWGVLGEFDVSEGHSATDVDISDMPFEALAVVLRVTADVNDPSSGIVIRSFEWGLPVARSVQAVDIRDTDPFEYVLHSGVARTDLRGPAIIAPWGCPPQSVGEINYASGQATVRFHQPTNIAWTNLSGASIAGFWENPYTKQRYPVSSVSFHQAKVRALKGDSLVGIGHDQLLICSTYPVFQQVSALPVRVRYLYFFNQDGQDNPDLRSRLNLKDWYETGYDDVVEIRAAPSGSQLYFVFPTEAPNPVTYRFRRHPRGLWETWEEVALLQGHAVRVFKCPNSLYESDYSLRVIPED